MMDNDKTAGPIGVLFWIAGVVALIWNGLGCMNFIQQLSPSGLSALPPEYQAYIELRPTWALVAFAVSVGAGLVAAILMLMRFKGATPAFVLSGVGALIVTVSTLSSGVTSVIIGSTMSVVFAAAFAWYTSRKLS
ncbi:hypothetical protein [Litoreibacter janthinus]|uniref:Uncharacterized protein n=1 Tax=Litoreibacter janthinus TaxID=670154 RepID=A0A1I6GQE6_9RHOB|nr:hypothetical protein [Litoreibacter janthinus]SFR44366.1 hypothetical protein SAMN04488002_1834 [Litoreibacter janthinus]